MIAMSSKKPTKAESKAGRARERGETRIMTVELEAALDDALEAIRQRDRRTKRAVVTLAIEEYLSRNGFWPPGQDNKG